MIPKTAVYALYNMWPMVILFTIVMILIRVVYLKSHSKKIIFYKELLSLLFILYILFLFELVTNTDFFSFSHNFIPFSEIMRYTPNTTLFYRNIIGNIFLFIPFGFFTAYYTKANKLYVIFIITFLSSLSIEVIQSIIGRTFDIDDIILNVTGGVIGYLVYSAAKFILKKQSIDMKNNIILNILFLIFIVVLIYIILSIYGVY